MRIALPGSVAGVLSPPYAGAIAKVRSVSVSRLVNASPSTIFELPADPRRHREMDGSSTLTGVRKAPERLFLGAQFSMEMKIRIHYLVRNTVSAFKESRVIAWHRFAQFVWRYDLEEVPGGTKVTESFNYDRPWAFVIIWLGWPERNRRAMQATLARINDIVTEQG
jgi:hypothetical protein